jgi:hypothetical protein
VWHGFGAIVQQHGLDVGLEAVVSPGNGRVDGRAHQTTGRQVGVDP